MLCSFLSKAQEIGDNIEILLNNGYTIKGVLIDKTPEIIKVSIINNEVLEYNVSDVKEIVIIKNKVKKLHSFKCSISVSGGLPLLNIKTKDYYGYFNYENVSDAIIKAKGVGSSVGFLVDFNVLKNFSIETGFNYYNIHKQFTVPEFESRTISMSNITIPLFFKYKHEIIKNLNLGIFVGPGYYLYTDMGEKALMYYSDFKSFNFNYGALVEYNKNKFGAFVKFNSVLLSDKFLNQGDWLSENYYFFRYRPTLNNLSIGLTYFIETKLK